MKWWKFICIPEIAPVWRFLVFKLQYLDFENDVYFRLMAQIWDNKQHICLTYFIILVINPNQLYILLWMCSNPMVAAEVWYIFLLKTIVTLKGVTSLPYAVAITWCLIQELYGSLCLYYYLSMMHERILNRYISQYFLYTWISFLSKIIPIK